MMLSSDVVVLDPEAAATRRSSDCIRDIAGGA
jgi:hypothetical protein